MDVDHVDTVGPKAIAIIAGAPVKGAVGMGVEVKWERSGVARAVASRLKGMSASLRGETGCASRRVHLWRHRVGG